MIIVKPLRDDEPTESIELHFKCTGRDCTESGTIKYFPPYPEEMPQYRTCDKCGCEMLVDRMGQTCAMDIKCGSVGCVEF